MRSKMRLKDSVLLAMLIITVFSWNNDLLSMNKVSNDASIIALLEEQIRLLSVEKEALVKENMQLQNDLMRIQRFYEEISKDIKWYIELSESPFTSEEAEDMVGYMTDDIIKAIMGFDPKTLARYIHPRKGVCFSASTMISRSDPVFTREQVSNFASDRQEYIWGIYSGTGDKIVLSPKAYFTEVLCNRRFEESIVRFNEVDDDFRGNHYLVYPNSVVVEYFYEGTEEWGFVDTAVVRIIFQQDDDQKWYIVGIIYNDRG
ncbi:MAG TPA: hypothetical protein GXZ97_05425 [Hydrogenispora sp.]|nr:hypothetical protein [Hydrogenispora sp.]